MKNNEELFSASDLENRLTQALEAAPVIPVPSGFVSRVMENLPARRSVGRIAAARIRQTYYGRKAMLISAVLLCLALAASMLVVQQRSMVSSVLQGVIFLQLACLVLGFCFRPWAQKI